MIEDYDLESSLAYYKEGALTVVEWVRSFKGVEEAMWFNWKDPRPFLMMCLSLVKRAVAAVTGRTKHKKAKGVST